MKLALSVSVMSAVIILTGCEIEVAPGGKESDVDAPNRGSTEKAVTIANVVRVFMHQPNEFTYFYTIPGDDKKVMIYKVTSTETAVIIADVDTEKDMWVKYQGSPGCGIRRQEIHIHSVSDINGTGWQRKSGKTTQIGTTHAIE